MNLRNSIYPDINRDGEVLCVDIIPIDLGLYEFNKFKTHIYAAFIRLFLPAPKFRVATPGRSKSRKSGKGFSYFY